MKPVYLLLGLLLCVGCFRQAPADVTLNILPDAAQVVRIRVDFQGERFEVPADHVASVLAALQPVEEIQQKADCRVIASVNIENKDAPTVSLLVHTRNHPEKFAAYGVGITEHKTRYRGLDATRLTMVLEAAAEAARVYDSK